MRHGTDARDISVVVPVYNEEECVEKLHEEIADALADYPHPWELILVDDCSTDRTPELIAAICDKDAHVRTIRFAQNCRQSAAMAAGFHHARGSIVVTLDGDLQNDPKDIPKLLEHMGEYDCVCGVRANRHDTRWRKIQSRIANRVRNWISGDHVTDTGCSLKAYRTDLLQKIYLFRGAHRFLPTLLRFEGANIHEVDVNHRERYAGQPKWWMWNRVFRATTDLFGVRWMKSRLLGYRVETSLGTGLPTSPADRAPGGATESAEAVGSSRADNAGGGD